MYAKINKYIKFKILKTYKLNKNLYKNYISLYRNKIILPESVYIEITNICNANCIFCAYQFYSAPKRIMSIEMFEKILKEINFLNINTVNLTPFAGEILTDKTIFKKLLLLKEYNFKKVTTYTNLINIDDNNISFLLNSGITDLKISTAPLDKNLYEGIYRVKKYDIFLSNLINLIKKSKDYRGKIKINIEFRSNLPKNECLKLKDYVRYIKPLLVDTDINIQVLNKFDSWMGAIQGNDLLNGMQLASSRKYKVLPCNRLNNIQILSNGDLRLCGCRFNHFVSKDFFYIGNYNKINIIDAFNSQRAKSVKKQNLFTSVEECKKCSWYNK